MAKVQQDNERRGVFDVHRHIGCLYGARPSRADGLNFSCFGRYLLPAEETHDNG
jgi:hypothetical protein